MLMAYTPASKRPDMVMRPFIAGVLLVVSLTTSDRVAACGDKYLNLGLGTRFDRSRQNGARPPSSCMWSPVPLCPEPSAHNRSRRA